MFQYRKKRKTRYLQGLLVMLLSLLLCGCQGKESISLPGDESRAYRSGEFHEELIFQEKDEKLLSVFLDQDALYAFVKKEGGQRTYQIRKIGNDNSHQEENQLTRYSQALDYCQKFELDRSEYKDVVLEAKCPGDGYLYLIGRSENGYIALVLRLYPDERNYDLVTVVDDMKQFEICNVEISSDGVIYVVADNKTYVYLEFYRYNENVHGTFNWTGYNYRLNQVGTFVAGKSVYYYVSDGRVYKGNNISGELTTDGFFTDLLTDKMAPACVDENDRIYVAQRCGILCHSKNGSLWELVMSGQNKDGFEKEDVSPLTLLKTSEDTYYLMVEEKNGGRRVYAYSND